MNSAKLHDWLQVVGLFGVIASLIFVGLQMKQTQEIAVAQAYTARAALSIESSTAVIGGSPAILTGLAKLYAGKHKELTQEEYVAIEHLFDATMTNIENNHFQYQAGFLPEGHWQKNVRSLQCMFDQPLYRSMRDDGFYYRPDFREVIEQAVTFAIENPENCWDWDPDSASFFPNN